MIFRSRDFHLPSSTLARLLLLAAAVIMVLVAIPAELVGGHPGI